MSSETRAHRQGTRQKRRSNAVQRVAIASPAEAMMQTSVAAVLTACREEFGPSRSSNLRKLNERFRVWDEQTQTSGTASHGESASRAVHGPPLTVLR